MLRSILFRSMLRFFCFGRLLKLTLIPGAMLPGRAPRFFGWCRRTAIRCTGRWLRRFTLKFFVSLYG